MPCLICLQNGCMSWALHQLNVWSSINRTFSQTHASSQVYLKSEMSIKSSAQLLYTESEKVNLEKFSYFTTQILPVLKTDPGNPVKNQSICIFSSLWVLNTLPDYDRAKNLSPQTRIHEKIKFAPLTYNGWQCKMIKEVTYGGECKSIFTNG